MKRFDASNQFDQSDKKMMKKQAIPAISAPIRAFLVKAAREAAAGGRPALVHLITDAEQIAPGRTITDLRGG